MEAPRVTPRPAGRGPDAILTCLVLGALAAFTLWQIPLPLLLANTTTVGGDTPAHHYLASHLKEQLFQHGRIISWASGWWCGFPMFQFYFPLPYVLMALLSCAIPFTLAFKWVTVAGILALPGAALVAARRLRLPRPVPWLMAIAMLPFLFVRTHTMWGVNVHSTLAGMIANSLSFPLMLLAVSSAWRDADEGRFRLRTVAWLAALFLSHFFTSIMAAGALALLPLLRPQAGFRKALGVLAREGGLAVLLTAWWLVPLLAKQEYAVDFGSNWDRTLLGPLPPYVPGLIPFILAACLLGWRRRLRAVGLWAWMGALSAGLFVFGFDLSPVFVNIRLWPFFFFAVMALAATGLGLLLERRPGHEGVVVAVLLATLVYTDYAEQGKADAGSARICATWNYEGLERKPGWPVLRDLVLPLRGTPGRLANDLTDDNNRLGSTRIFELAPYLAGKPVLEGGLVNSAIGAYFSYAIQGETSRNCAGYPDLVRPRAFNITNATQHLALFNVTHFIARWEQTQRALRNTPGWQPLGKCQGWELFALTNHSGRYVFIPSRRPIGLRTAAWKEAGLEWFYTLGAIDQPFALLGPGDPDLPEPATVCTEARFRQFLTRNRPHPETIQEWLHLGPFPYPRDMARPLEWAPIDEAQADPREGDRTCGRRWQLLYGEPPLSLDSRHHQRQHIVSYSFVNLFVPTARDAMLRLSHDDGAAVWLNGKPVWSGPITGLDESRTVRVRLQAGRNRLLHKLEQSVGGEFFDVRLTDLQGQAFTDVTCSVVADPGALQGAMGEQANETLDASRYHLVEQSVSDDHIRFTTDAIGLPHMIKVSYYPNWQVRGARHVYRVTPAFMLVYPTSNEVELYYGTRGSDRAGYGLTWLGILLTGAVLLRRRMRKV